jgi:hypothetical protein
MARFRTAWRGSETADRDSRTGSRSGALAAATSSVPPFRSSRVERHTARLECLDNGQAVRPGIGTCGRASPRPRRRPSAALPRASRPHADRQGREAAQAASRCRAPYRRPSLGREQAEAERAVRLRWRGCVMRAPIRPADLRKMAVPMQHRQVLGRKRPRKQTSRQSHIAAVHNI